MRPVAVVRHRSDDRIRLGVAAMRRDAAYFDWVRDELLTNCDCLHVTVDALSAGILIKGYTGTLRDLQQLGIENAWFDLRESAARPAALPAETLLPDLPIDRQSIAVGAVLSLAIYQAMRG